MTQNHGWNHGPGIVRGAKAVGGVINAALVKTLSWRYLQPRPSWTQERLSLSMLQNKAPCAIASSSATWLWGSWSNHRFGMLRLVLLR